MAIKNKPRSDMQIGAKHTMKRNGELEILEYISTEKVIVRFTQTGTVVTTTTHSIRDKTTKDPFKPSVFGIGYLGVGKYPTTVNGKNSRCYCIWKAMLGRCYYLKDAGYKNYGARGVTVCSEWHNYQTFAHWAANANFFEGAQLDKDIRGNGMLYSPDNCSFVTRLENNRHQRPRPKGIPNKKR